MVARWRDLTTSNGWSPLPLASILSLPPALHSLSALSSGSKPPFYPQDFTLEAQCPLAWLFVLKYRRNYLLSPQVKMYIFKTAASTNSRKRSTCLKNPNNTRLLAFRVPTDSPLHILSSRAAPRLPHVALPSLVHVCISAACGKASLFIFLSLHRVFFRFMAASQACFGGSTGVTGGVTRDRIYLGPGPP
ncbi:hypothetical protein B0H13DRAFT_2388195 [Mycena leptocephala]|nr:hypothetical protein B0H13DRAFT_2388195 [Mycena leptocephala]